MPSKNNESSAGFSISVHGQGVVEDNARERFGPDYGEPDDRERALAGGWVNAEGEITRKGWDLLAGDINQIERNSMAWLRKTFATVRDDGHDRYDDLVGSFWFDPHNPDQAWLIELASDGTSGGRQERIDMVDLSYGNLASTAFNGVSDFGASVLGGQITFFGVKPEDMEIIEKTLASERKRAKGRGAREASSVMESKPIDRKTAMARYRAGNNAGLGFAPPEDAVRDAVEAYLAQRGRWGLVYARRTSDEVAVLESNAGELIAIGGDAMGRNSWAVDITNPIRGTEEIRREHPYPPARRAPLLPRRR